MIAGKVLKEDEKAIFALRGLYQKYGYAQYKMNKFEEYDLYVRNKNFLVSDHIITFTNTDGKLMALKPDVTLSIIKNTKDAPGCVEKVYYNENVYRVSKSTDSFTEIMQTGLECIGDIDDYNIYEVLMLAAESLRTISEDFVLDISHLGIVSSVISAMNVSRDAEKALIQCISEKNIHEISAICAREGADGETLKKIVSTYGAPKRVIPVLRELVNEENKASINQLITLVEALEANGFAGKIFIDFSVINDMHYYNGVVFKGFIKGIANGILSGGQYDNLMTKMRRKSGAIGFAVYLDMLERLTTSDEPYDVDILLLYESADVVRLNEEITKLTQDGQSVMAQKEMPEKIRYKKLLKLTERGVETVELNA